MRILMFSWEYPPHVVGGLGRHVDELSRAMVRDGHDVHVITRGEISDPPDEITEAGVHVRRVASPPPTFAGSELLAWVMFVNGALQAGAAELLRDTTIDVIHAHDWLVASAAAHTKHTFDVPMVATVHATEYGRHQGHLPQRMNELIHQVEWWLTYEARRVITCSQYMADQAQDIFALPAGKVTIIPNGVDADFFARPELRLVDDAARPQLLFAGRLEYEKGVQVLLDALVHLRDEFAQLHLQVAGDGTYAQALRDRTADLELNDAVTFTGFLDRVALRDAYHQADVVVVPSIYEPFGMVALEAMAAGAGLVVSDVGGLVDVRHEATPTAPPFDDRALAASIADLLRDDSSRRQIAHRQAERARQLFGWQQVSRDTVTEYGRALTKERALRLQDSVAVDEAAAPDLADLLAASPLLTDTHLA